jgi:hypothetical protein
LLLSAKEINWVAPQIGLPIPRMAEIRALDKDTTEITEVYSQVSRSDSQTNIKHMVQGLHPLSHINMEKTKPHSLWLTLDLFLNHAHIIALVQILVVEEVLSVEDVDNSRDLVAEVVLVEELKVADGVKDSVGEDLAGKIMTNHNAFVMQVFKSSRIGSYLKRSSSIGYLSLL